MQPSPVSRIGVEERVGWMRERLHAVDADCVRLVEEVRGGVLVDADEVRRRLVALEVQIDTRRSDVAIWRAYFFPPRSRVGQGLYLLGEGLIRLARRIG